MSMVRCPKSTHFSGPAAQRSTCVQRVVLLFAVIVLGLVTSENAEAQLFRRLQARRQLQQQVQPRPPAANRYAPPRSTSPSGLSPANGSRRPDAAKPSVASPVERVGQSQAAKPKKARGARDAASANRPGAPTARSQPNFRSFSKSRPRTGVSSSASATGESTKIELDAQEKEYGRSILSLGNDDEPSWGDEDSGQAEAASNEQASANDQLPQQISLGIDILTPRAEAVGVRVAHIRADSLADEAGLRAGDTIISIDGQPTRTLREISSSLDSRKVGERVEVRFIRGRVTYITSVPLIERASAPVRTADQQQVAVPPKKKSAVRLGLMIEDRDRLRGTVVTNVREGTFASMADIRPGDRIVSIDGRMIANGNALRSEVSRLEQGDLVKIGLVRAGQLISRNVHTQQTNLHDGDTTSVAAAATIKKGTSKEDSPGLASGLGSMISGLFSGNAPSESADKTPPEQPELPIQPASFDDEMAFGDNEPVENNLFGKGGNHAATSFEKKTVLKPSTDQSPRLIPGDVVETKKPKIELPSVNLPPKIDEVMELPPGKKEKVAGDVSPPQSQPSALNKLPSKLRRDAFDRSPSSKEEAARLRKQIKMLQMKLNQIEGK